MKFGSSFKSLLYPPSSSSSSSPDSGSCFFCDKGQTSRCEQSRVFGSVPLDGAQAEYVLVPLADTTLYPIPAGAKPEVLLLMADVSSKKFKRKKPCRIIFTPSFFFFSFFRSFPRASMSQTTPIISLLRRKGKMSQPSLLVVGLLGFVLWLLLRISSRWEKERERACLVLIDRYYAFMTKASVFNFFFNLLLECLCDRQHSWSSRGGQETWRKRSFSFNRWWSSSQNQRIDQW